MNTEANNPMEQDFNKMIEEYDQYEWQYLKTKEELRTLWSLDVMTYTIYWDDNNNADGMRPDEVIVGVADGYDIPQYDGGYIQGDILAYKGDQHHWQTGSDNVHQ